MQGARQPSFPASYLLKLGMGPLARNPHSTRDLAHIHGGTHPTLMPHDLPKAYDPTAIEDHWAEYWVREDLFAQPTPASAAQDGPSPYTILLPPPNVTGNLHMGHMFEHTESDILARWRRMCGSTVLWIPG